MRSRNMILIALFSSLITVFLIVIVFTCVSSTLANNVFQAGDPPVLDSPEIPEDEEEMQDDTCYLHTTGLDFKEFSGSATYTASSGGCIYLSSGNYLFSAIDLPHGSMIKTMYLYFRDSNSGGNGRLDFYQYNDGYVGTLLASIYTDDAHPGDNDSNVTYMDLDVNNYDYSYGVEWYVPLNGTSLQICGYRITYTVPSVFGSALPIIKR
ncbi:MAG: hypothetical protein JW704_08680 [Anaerolineaceae bacterium]|nr:hypothetical protein [Anaerolineaceae bacterium]MBN2678095.1 hypothetical protein [Anaerolineaceae bacterium]